MPPSQSVWDPPERMLGARAAALGGCVLPRDREKASEDRASDVSVGVVPVPTAAAAARKAAGGHFFSLRRALRTEGEARGCEDSRYESPLSNLHLSDSDWFLKIDMAASKEEVFRNKTESLRPMLTVQYPNFTRDSAEHDLMLIKLKQPLKLNSQVKLVALPNTTDDRRGDTCTVSGWGWKWENSNTDPDIQINQTVFWFSDEYCQESPVRQIPVKITENMFCAGSSLESAHTCKEMAAAPILCQNQLQGILSWSDGCILRGDIGYYTKVAHYTDWILKVIHTN
ncbi:PREDICTED: serine protease 58-like [Hipposideros armiger]|uniref:Serine protease 58-like n=1 Tax=Hipposideros armiger TaxID=186990 RepID=A0A8B7T057_HIPAR|nr:PREDICTED: serine protease 58-like [Hipposideros armiger]